MSLDALKQKLGEYFESFALGDDVPPAKRYFIEGYIQALLDSQSLSDSEARQLIASCCEASLGEDAARVYREQEGDIVLHSHMRRAPVYPTTSQ